MKKYTKIAAGVIAAGVFVGTFGFLYKKSQPEVVVYATHKPARK